MKFPWSGLYQSPLALFSCLYEVDYWQVNPSNGQSGNCEIHNQSSRNISNRLAILKQATSFLPSAYNALCFTFQAIGDDLLTTIYG